MNNHHLTFEAKMDSIGEVMNVSNHSHLVLSNISNNQSIDVFSSPYKFMIPTLSIIAVIAIIGNIFCIITISKTPSLHTASNITILNLATIDLFTGIVVIPTAILVVFLGKKTPSWLCSLQGFLIIAAYGTSLLAIVHISIDRFRAVTRPYHYSSTASKKYFIKMIPAMLIPITIAVLPLFQLTQFGLGSYTRTFVCFSRVCYHGQRSYITGSSTAALITVCLSIIIICYIRIFIIAIGKNKNKFTQGQRSMNTKSVRTTALIVGTNSACFFPQLISFTLALIKCNNEPPRLLQAILYAITLSNSAFNPIVYITTNSILRKKLLQLFSIKLIANKSIPNSNSNLPHSKSQELSIIPFNLTLKK